MEKWWRAFRRSIVSTPPHVVVNHKLNGCYGWSFDTICGIFAGHVSTARVDLDGLQPRIRILVWTILHCSFAAVRADCHRHVLAEDVIRRLGHIGEPKDQRNCELKRITERMTCNSWLGHNGWLPPHIFLSCLQYLCMRKARYHCPWLGAARWRGWLQSRWFSCNPGPPQLARSTHHHTHS